MNYNWVKKEVSKKEWSGCYSNLPGYCSLGVGYMGFLVAEEIPEDCELCDVNEIRQMDMYRRANNIRPFPLSEENPQDSFDDYENKEELKNEYKKVKDDFPDIFKNAEK